MTKTFKGRAVLRGIVEGEAVVSRNGFNAYASFYTSLADGVQIAICADSGNPDTYGKELSGKILCIPNSTGSTSAGAVWQRIACLGIAPKAVLFSQGIDSLAAGGVIVADKWAGISIPTIDQLGMEFLERVQDGDLIKIQEDGTVIIHNPER